MNIEQVFQANSEKLVKSWIEAVIKTYPDKSQAHMLSNQDPFTNPIGGMIKEAALGLIQALSGASVDINMVKQSLDRLIKIRAVQTLTASQSLGILYLLKPLLRQHILPEMNKGRDLAKYLEIESRLDTLVLLAFDLYVQNREQLAENRINEIRNQYAELKRWAQKLNADAPLGTFAGCGN
ncbi:MAG: RsbRD N-terminal domain-containing protein [Desulfovibrionaceae bacterium]|nr:RsbRD N-terminal domain-containing protein [Desulfovibrionaceae bacterium]